MAVSRGHARCHGVPLSGNMSFSPLDSKIQFQVKKSIFGGIGNTAAFSLNTGTTPWSWDIPSNTHYYEPMLSRRMHGCIDEYFGNFMMVGGFNGSGATLQQVRTSNWYWTSDSGATYAGHWSPPLPSDINVSDKQ